MSLRADLLTTVLRLTKAKKIAEKSIYHPQRKTGSLAPDKFNKRFTVNTSNIDGFDLLSVRPANAKKMHIFFLHGGAYVLEPLPSHRSLIEKFAINTAATVHFLFYPLAPENTFELTHKIVTRAYHKVIADYPKEEFWLFGDSAGGGLALAFLQTLSQQRVSPMPTKTVLVSPWVDLSLSNPSIKAVESQDPILSVPALQFAAKHFAGNTDLKNPVISPLYGSKENLGPILLLFGTNELFYPDLKELQSQLEMAKGTSAEVVVASKMLHDWILLPVPEAKQTIQKITNWFLQEL